MHYPPSDVVKNRRFLQSCINPPHPHFQDIVIFDGFFMKFGQKSAIVILELGILSANLVILSYRYLEIHSKLPKSGFPSAK